MTEADYLQLQSERTVKRLRAAMWPPAVLRQSGLAEFVRRRPGTCLVAAVAGGILAAGLLIRVGPAPLLRGARLAARAAAPTLRAALAATLGLNLR